ncbi:MAG: DNA methyltransferase, partial [Pseudomonadota bacterium]
MVHTNFTNAANIKYTFTHAEIAASVRDARGRATENKALRVLRDMFTNPENLHPNRQAAEVTAEAAAEFEKIASAMRAMETADPRNIAHFLTKVLFCLFAEDVGLLKTAATGRGLFSEIIEETYQQPSLFIQYAGELFEKMANGGNMMMREVAYFNGKLFEDVTVEELPYEALLILRNAALLDWSNVEPAIFGTLFERSLDPAKRSQLGAHYTSPDDINLIIGPVLMDPLRRAWDEAQTDADLARPAFDNAKNRREQVAAAERLTGIRDGMLAQLREITVLDPACGSGNFLYMSLRALLDLEKEIITYPAWNGDGFTAVIPEVHPSQMYGIELNPIAHDLATIVVWIGWIQWKINNGYPSYPEPILKDLGENIQQMDAILAFDEAGNPTEPEWPAVDVIVGNPPFLGAKKMRLEIGDDYVDSLRKLY